MDDMQKLEQMLSEISALEQRAQALRAAADAIGRLEWCSTCQRNELFRPGQWPPGWSSYHDPECWIGSVDYYCPAHAADCPRYEDE
ncbi:MAG: hypothetical protein K2W95_14720 [Candidatus Obscuribacterales bacterium]|nr:hypothetical protein [Candidatus Obscuribacterales bacterium]